MFAEEIHFDPEDYASRPDSLPPNSLIGQAIALGARFELDPGKKIWFAKHLMRTSCGKTQVQAARNFLNESR